MSTPDESIASLYPIEYRAYVADLSALRERATTYPFTDKPLGRNGIRMIGEVLDNPERFWPRRHLLESLYVHPHFTFGHYLRAAGWDEQDTPTYDQLREALAKAADANRRDQHGSNVSVAW
jgi:hypothetical protein